MSSRLALAEYLGRKRRLTAAVFVLLAAMMIAPKAIPAKSSLNPAVKPGVEVLLAEPEYLDMLKGKRVGLITNPSGVDHLLNSTIDLLNDHPDIELAALFGPEHGVRGDAYAGDKVTDAVDHKTGVKVYSLYGKNRRPSKEMMEGLDIMVYDIQDVGSRSYTYIYTMAYGMEACAEAGIPFMVLDRPNPAGAHIVDGNILNPEYYSGFVGMYPIAYQYGMTPGEVAMMFNKEYNKAECELLVVPMRGYKRNMLQEDTGLPFIPASTHIPRSDVALYYNLTGVIGEIRAPINIGVGYTLPFETMAAPWMDRDKFTEALTAKHLPGLLFRPISYKPYYAGCKDEMCHGVQIYISDFHAVRPVTAQIHIMEVIQTLFPEADLFSDEKAKSSLFDEVLGTEEIRHRIRKGDKAEDIIADYQPAVDEWMNVRAKYLIYE